mgnify:CR=1 FL=1
MNRNWYIINKLFHRFVKPYYQIIQKAVINKKYPIQQQRYLNSQKYRDWCQNNSDDEEALEERVSEHNRQDHDHGNRHSY